MNQLQEITVLICTYNARTACELTLETLYAIAGPIIHQTIIVNSSDDIITTEFLENFKTKHSNVTLENLTKKTPHWDALVLGLRRHIKTPYVLLSDSDIEYLNGDFFTTGIEALKNDKNLFMVGELRYDQHKNNDLIRQMPRLAPYACLLSTNKLNKYIPYFGLHWEKDSRFMGNKYYDTGAGVFEQACTIDGLGYKDIGTQHNYFIHHWGSSRVDDIIDKHPGLKELLTNQQKDMEQKVKNKVWEKLIPISAK